MREDTQYRRVDLSSSLKMLTFNELRLDRTLFESTSNQAAVNDKEARWA